MSLKIDKILAPAPAINPLGNDEGLQPTQLSVDAKGERITYAVRTLPHSLPTSHTLTMLP